jgi:hypothetical protein
MKQSQHDMMYSEWFPVSHAQMASHQSLFTRLRLSAGHRAVTAHLSHPNPLVQIPTPCRQNNIWLVKSPIAPHYDIDSACFRSRRATGAWAAACINRIPLQKFHLHGEDLTRRLTTNSFSPFFTRLCVVSVSSHHSTTLCVHPLTAIRATSSKNALPHRPRQHARNHDSNNRPRTSPYSHSPPVS